jgi:hypoxanthine-guanine phosphoribosyltransferase
MKKRALSKPRKRPTKVQTAGSGVRCKVVVEEKAIRKRVRELARQINRDYAGKALHVVGILEDSFVFMADLIRALTVPVVCSFGFPISGHHYVGYGLAYQGQFRNLPFLARIAG